MTPAARWAAAIDILETVRAGDPVERALTTWGRRNRYAGSKDRAAIRDIVFDITRRRRSTAWRGGGETGRALVLGAIRLAEYNPDVVFSGERYAPEPLTEAERGAGHTLDAAPRAVRLDLQDWVLGAFDAALGDKTEAIADLLRQRAPVMLRVNRARVRRDDVIAALAEAGYDAAPVALSPTALAVTGRVRGLPATAAYEAGLFEMQDAASQAVVDRVADGIEGARVLDYCAGGGGKALALAAYGAVVTAHDAFPKRMADLPARAGRAGVRIETTEAPEGRFDLVLCDAPCSGSGAWRRQPEGKWLLTEAGLSDLTATQDAILARAAGLVATKGRLAYATCSLFEAENSARAEAFLTAHPGWEQIDGMQLTPLDGGDGFYLAVFARR